MSNDVTRFRATYDDDFVVEHPHGDYVRYTAYAALAARLREALRKAEAALSVVDEAEASDDVLSLRLALDDADDYSAARRKGAR